MSSPKRTGTALAVLPRSSDLVDWAKSYDTIALDLGAGDARYARALAGANPCTGVIALDTCADKARPQLRRAPENLRFIVADACDLPAELIELADEITINFPWGSLLRALLDEEAALRRSLSARSLTIRVNAGALAEAGFDYDAGATRLWANLNQATGAPVRMRHLERDDLRRLPTTWAKRLAFGRDPRAVEFSRLRRVLTSAAD